MTKTFASLYMTDCWTRVQKDDKALCCVHSVTTVYHRQISSFKFRDSTRAEHKCSEIFAGAGGEDNHKHKLPVELSAVLSCSNTLLYSYSINRPCVLAGAKHDWIEFNSTTHAYRLLPQGIHILCGITKLSL